MDWAQILVIILSIFLAIFLLVAIILVVLLIKVTRKIQKVTDSAHSTMENVERMASKVTNLTSLNFIAGMVTKRFTKLKNRNRREK